MMIRKSCLIAMAILLTAGLAFGAEGKGSKKKTPAAKGQPSSTMSGLGVGLIVGSPTGISAKYYFGKNFAADAAFGWSIGDEFVRFHSDFLMHNAKLFQKAFDFPAVLYYGVGAKFLFANQLAMGVRVPVGVLYNFKDPRVDLFLELVPVVQLIPDTDFDFDAAIGARYYFKL